LSPNSFSRCYKPKSRRYRRIEHNRHLIMTPRAPPSCRTLLKSEAAAPASYPDSTEQVRSPLSRRRSVHLVKTQLRRLRRPRRRWKVKPQNTSMPVSAQKQGCINGIKSKGFGEKVYQIDVVEAPV